jgi:N4-gp56 family major capsid protein
MANNTNTSSQFTADIQNFIQKKTIRLVDRQLVLYQFGDKAVLPKNRGTVYTASQYNRVNLPFAPLSEGIPPVGETMTLTQVSATAQQWGDTINVTDVADLTIDHPIFQKAIELIALQQAETLERNTANVLMGGTQVNYVNSRGSRAALTSTDYLNPFELNRAVGALRTIGAPEFMGQANEDEKIEAGKPSMASKDPRGFQHYVSVLHPLVEQDMRNNSQVVTAWSYSDINKLYNNELGEYAGIRFTRSNMVPYFVGVANVTATGNTTGGSLAAATYSVQVTGSVAQNGYETLIYQAGNVVVGGSGAGSVTLTTPSTTGYLYNVYITSGSSVALTNLGLSASGPTVGPLAGNAVQIPPSTAVTITGVGVSRTPPAAPATGVTVYPTFIFGKGSYAQVMLDEAKVTYLDKAEKLDPLNQLRIVGWKIFYGTLIINQQFFMRIESASQFSATFG